MDDVAKRKNNKSPLVKRAKELTYVEKPNLVYEKMHNANIKDFSQQESDFFQAQYFRALGEVG